MPNTVLIDRLKNLWLIENGKTYHAIKNGLIQTGIGFSKSLD